MSEHQHIPPDLEDCYLDKYELAYEPFGEAPLDDAGVVMLKNFLRPNYKLRGQLAGTMAANVLREDPFVEDRTETAALWGAEYRAWLDQAVLLPDAEWLPRQLGYGAQAHEWGTLIDQLSCDDKVQAVTEYMLAIGEYYPHFDRLNGAEEQ